MNNPLDLMRWIVITTVVSVATTTAAFGQNVDTRLSSREAYIGMPVVLEISIRNASNYEPPSIPAIDGCEIRSAGTPAQSSQITIINGRRSESRSVVMRYLITPRRPGSYEIPALELRVDGKTRTTKPMSFVATRSETGDLLFVEIDGGEKSVYVGQPLELKLKIWIKRFVDRENGIQLSEANMWQLISEQTSWGSFSDRLRELADNNQRPGGREVLRDNGQGQKRSYFLYEIDATVYPTHPGKIDANDVQIVVNYPTALGKSRDPFDDFFKGSPFAGRMSQMMDDDFFSSPFGRRLTIKSARPIVAEATVDSTEVRPVPTMGRPADYRGAVGNYRIITNATPINVNAGDPVTLSIGIVGDGPMELVPAPPLSILPDLTTSFKVTDQSLAGFVKEDGTKVFVTKIRPRREGITQIPAIPFSFFDPDAESFQTVYSEPISITVNKSEMLKLDSIVGTSKQESPDDEQPVASGKPLPDLTNHPAATILKSQRGSRKAPWWVLFAIGPPIVWLATVAVCSRGLIAAFVPSFKSPRTRCLGQIKRADNGQEITNAIVDYVSRRSRSNLHNPQAAIGTLRISGMQSTANTLESFLSKCERNDHWPTDQSLPKLKLEAIQCLDQLEREFAVRRRKRIKRGPQRISATSPSSSRSKLTQPPGNLTGLLLVGLFAWSASSPAWAAPVAVEMPNLQQSPNQPQTTPPNVAADRPGTNSPSFESGLNFGRKLTDSQREIILQEANSLYADALEAAQTDSAESSEGFAAAAAKYQLIVDSSVRSSRLFINLGNAYLQSGELGRAIVNYERARQLTPFDKQVLINLSYAQAQISAVDSDSSSRTDQGDGDAWQAALKKIRAANDALTGFAGPVAMIWILAVSSILFWCLMIFRTVGLRFPVWRIATPIGLLLGLALLSVVLTKTGNPDGSSGIVVAQRLELHSGDGVQFPTTYSIESAQGLPVTLRSQRGNWMQVETSNGRIGWTESDSIERILLP